MIVVRPTVVRPVLDRGAAVVRACAQGVGAMLGQLGELGPAGVGVSLMLAGGLGVLALRMMVFSEETTAASRGPSRVVVERTVRPPAGRSAVTSARWAAAPSPHLILLAGTPEHAERLRAAMSEANVIRDAEHQEPLEYEVYLITTPEDEERIRETVTQYNLESEVLGTPPIAIIDFRTPGQPCEPDGQARC